jgi:hypothetical protein
MRRYHSDHQQEARAYYRLLRHLLADEVQRNFKEEQQLLPAPMSDLMRRLETALGNHGTRKEERNDVGSNPDKR